MPEEKIELPKEDILFYGEKKAKRAIVYLAVLSLLKAFAGYFTGIVILLADAVYSVADILSIFASYLGLRLSRKKEGGAFKYGYYKAETLAALIVSIITSVLGIDIFLISLDRFLESPQISNPAIGFFAIIVNIIVSYYLYVDLKKAAQKTNSLSLRNNAIDKKNDILRAVVIVFGILASMYSIKYIEGAIGMIISLMILHSGLKNGKDSLFFLLDYWDDPKLINKIRNTIVKDSLIVKTIKQIRLRRAGTFIFGEIYLEIIPFAKMEDLRVELDKLQKKILGLDPYIKNLIIYTLVPKPSTVRVAVPIEQNNGLKSSISRNFDKTENYLLANIRDNKISKWEVVNFPYDSNDFPNIIKFFKKHKINIVVDNDMHSLVYCEIIAKSHISVFPHFSNVKDAEGMLKLLM